MAQSQILANGTSDAGGNITILFPPINVNATFTGRISVPQSANSVEWQVVLNDVVIATIVGPTSDGSHQFTSTDVVKLVSTSASPSTQYQGVIRGVLTTAGVAAVVPTPTAAAVNAIAPLPPGVVFPTQFVTPGGGGTATETIVIPVTTRTLVLTIRTFGPTGITEQQVSNVLVEGGVTNQNYYNQPPYLVKNSFGGVNFYTIVVPILGVVDPSVTIVVTVTGNNNAFDLTVYADSEEYDESIFYNGVAQAVSIASAGTLLTGPARLLAIDASPVSGATAVIALNGNNVLQATGVPGEEMTFPDNTILPAGQSLTTGVSGGAALFTAAYAYP